MYKMINYMYIYIYKITKKIMKVYITFYIDKDRMYQSKIFKSFKKMKSYLDEVSFSPVFKDGSRIDKKYPDLRWNYTTNTTED